MESLPNNSFWETDTFFRPADYAIIGSGIVGLNAAIRLRELRPKARIVILDRGNLPLGASTRNAGFACFGSPTELLEDLEHHTETEVWDLVAERWSGLQALRNLVGDPALQYETHGGSEIFKPSDEVRFQKCLAKLDDFNHHFQEITGIPEVLEVADHLIPEFQFKDVAHIIRSKIEGQLHPAKMIRCLQYVAHQNGIESLNGMTVEGIVTTEKTVEIHTRTNLCLQANHILIATNGFARQLLPDLDVLPARNQVLITKPVPNLTFKGCFHYEGGYYYFRNVGQRILLGGGRNLAKTQEQTDVFGTTPLIRAALMDLLQRVILPEQVVEIEQWWSGILGVGAQKKPIIKPINERVAVAVRLGGMGVAIGTTVGRKAAALINDL